ncbi:ribokinase [candidate division WOR-3 bacterium]|nr:ribokinase [candidate division WOR-3 bacterium]
MKGGQPRVVVVGSMVMDLVFRVGHRPKPGETLLGEGFAMFLGGKGFNQAIACHRLGAETTLVGRVGRDEFGDRFIRRLHDERISTRFVSADPEHGTGVASPTVYPDGGNSIIGVPRANLALTPADVEAAEDRIAAADVLMLQFEVNPEASQAAAHIARRHGTLVLLDPAPVHAHCENIDWPIDFLVPNEVEAQMLADCDSPEEWARELYDEELEAVVISRGAAGALVIDGRGVREFPGFRVRAVDTTGAGDAFRAGLAVMVARGRGLDEAVRFANACGALACTREGAEPSMPRLDEVLSFAGANEPAG